MSLQIALQEKIGSHYYHLIVTAPEIAKNAEPGQFVMIKVSSQTVTDPLLRRPVSIMDVIPEKEQIALLYRIAGRGTCLLATRQTGDSIDLIGPLGNGFPVISEPHTAVLVGGGVGIPPLVFLAHRLSSRNDVKVHAFIGARSEKDLVCKLQLIQHGAEVVCTTETGDAGFQGYVTDAVSNFFTRNSRLTPVIYACGPKPMLKKLVSMAENKHISAYVSLEEHMGCGVGACLGCVVETNSGYRTVCSDGPVFNASELVKW